MCIWYTEEYILQVLQKFLTHKIHSVKHTLTHTHPDLHWENMTWDFLCCPPLLSSLFLLSFISSLFSLSSNESTDLITRRLEVQIEVCIRVFVHLSEYVCVMRAPVCVCLRKCPCLYMHEYVCMCSDCGHVKVAWLISNLARPLVNYRIVGSELDS